MLLSVMLLSEWESERDEDENRRARTRNDSLGFAKYFGCHFRIG